MLVCRNGYTPVSDTDYCPNTLYGTSKVEGERLVRSNTSLPWVIVRPTSIWGPWFGEPYRSFFAAVFAGRYVHPGKTVVNKALGFVGNVVHQLAQLLGADLRSVHRRTFYLCDYPHYSVHDWAESVAKTANARAIRTVPSSVLQLAAWCGDFAKVIGYKNPPLTSFRLRNMLTPSRFDVSSLLAVVGQTPYSMQEGVDLTVRWMRRSMIARSVN
jgi:nucleoside-diphosphate-sugar epimerase